MRLPRLTLMLCVCALALAAAPIAHAADQIWWTADGDNAISRANLDGSGGGVTVLSGAPLSAPWGLALDPARSRAFALTYGAPGALYAMGLDGTGATTLTPPGVTLGANMYDLTYDPATRRLYWPDQSAILWAAADGSAGGELYAHASLPAGADGPSQIAIDPGHNKLYWANFSGGTIGYAALDGSGGIGTLTLSGTCTGAGTNGEGLAVDGAGGTLYILGESGGNRLIAADLDGANCRDLLPGPLPDSLGLAVDTDTGRLYWGEYTAKKLGWVSVSDPTSTGYLDTGTAKVTKIGYPTILKKPDAVSASLTFADGLLTCTATWRGDEPGVKLLRAPASTGFVWKREGTTIAGATGPTLRPTKPGGYLCTASATNGAGTGAITPGRSLGASKVTVTNPAGRVLRVRAKQARLVVRLGSAGTVKVVATAGGRTVASGSATQAGTGKVAVKLKLTAAGAARLKRAGSKGLGVKVVVTGAERVAVPTRRTLTLRLRG